MLTIDNPVRIGHQANSIYHGDNPEWIIVYANVRSEDLVDVSNIEVFDNLLDAADPNGEHHHIEGFGGAFGQIDYLIVDPEHAPTMALARETLERLDDYPVLDEEHWGNLEYEQAYEWVTSELERRWAWFDRSNEFIELVAGEYLNLHNYGSEAPTEWDHPHDRKVLADAIRNARKHQRGQVVTY